MRKPDPKIYLMMCELLAVKPEACVYLDDLGHQLQTGRRPGHDRDQGGDRGPGPGRPGQGYGTELLIAPGRRRP